MNEAQTAAQRLIERVDAALPQTQCTQCGFSGCMPYAQAIVLDGCNINQCPPGGTVGIAKLAAITQRPAAPLNPANGREAPLQLARIEEEFCIGCTLCIQACPVDAIVGANKLMHTILADQCTGCALCVPPCPVDCIAMEDAGFAWTEAKAVRARQDFSSRNARLRRERDDTAPAISSATDNAIAPTSQLSAKAAMIAAAVERARKQRQ